MARERPVHDEAPPDGPRLNLVHGTAAAAAEPAADGTALTRLFAEVGRDLRRALQLLLRNHADVEDVAQEACLKVWDRRHTIRETNPRGFLFRTAANLALERRRTQRRRGESVALDAAEPQPVELPLQDLLTPERHVGARDELLAVQRAFARLNERQRRAFELSLEGYSQAAIARMLGVSQSAVWKYLDRATAALHAARQAAGRDGDFPAPATVVEAGRKR